jgi:hypothetical protein
MSIEPSKFIDCDGPWIYQCLQHFIKLYLNHNNQIPFSEISKFVDKFYIHEPSKIRNNIKKQLFAFQH